MQIDWNCFANRSGYAQAAQDYLNSLKILDKYDIKVSLLHSSPEQLSLSSQSYIDLINLMKKERDPHAIQVYHCIPDMQKRAERLGKTVGFATFETFEPPKEWVDVLNTNDAVICPSLFNMKIFKHAGVDKPLYYVPHCVNIDAYHPGVIPSLKSDVFTFMCFGAWKKRKGWPQLLEAWSQEFKPDEKVRLVIKTDRHTMANIAVDQTVRNMGLTRKDIAPIEFESKILTDTELPSFMKSADCLICPTMGEGFGIPGLQCMALGVPVVITNFSGCTDYANEQTATLIEPNRFIIYNEMDNIPQFRNKKWANVTTEEVRLKMRFAFQNQSIIKAKADAAVSFVKENFSYQKTAERLSQLFESLQ